MSVHLSRRLQVSVALALVLPGCGDDDCRPGWKEVLDKSVFDRPLLSIFGRGDDVYLVGGGVGSTSAPPGVMMHWDGKSWSFSNLGPGQTFWWIWGPEGEGQMWLVGEGGLALRYDGTLFHPAITSTTATLYGVWGSGGDDVWVVGGSPGKGQDAPNDIVLHWDGQGLTPAGPPARGTAFFKVWGSGKDDVWVVGEGGAIWQRKADGWHEHTSGTRDNLTTVHGCSSTEIYAVGGMDVLKYDGAGWAKVPGAVARSTTVGVFCGRDQVLVTGSAGLKLRYDRQTDRWLDETLDEPYHSDFHAAWISPSGALWASGGNYNAPAATPRLGVVGFRGCPVPE